MGIMVYYRRATESMDRARGSQAPGVDLFWLFIRSIASPSALGLQGPVSGFESLYELQVGGCQKLSFLFWVP